MLIGDLFKTMLNNIVFQNGLNHTPIDFCEQAKHIRGSQINFTFSRSLNCILAILKDILELEEWTNRNQEFSKWTNMKQQGPHRNLVDVSRINVISPICFHQNRMGNCNNEISSDTVWRPSHIPRKKVSPSTRARTQSLCRFSLFACAFYKPVNL